MRREILSIGILVLCTSLKAQTNIFPSSGNTGIGTITPSDKLQVVGDIGLGLNSTAQIFFRYGGISTGGDLTSKQNGTDMMSFGFNNEGAFSGIAGASTGREIYFYDRFASTLRGVIDGTGTWWFGSSTTNYGLKIAAPVGSATGMTINSAGNVGIGTSAPGTFKLAVEGNIAARKLIVTQTTPWPDYVFHKNHKLPLLEEIEKYILLNQHLPDMPSAAEVKKNGVDLGENQTALLKKTEELTLYIIEQNKESIAQGDKIDDQQKLITEQQTLLKKLQQLFEEQQLEIKALQSVK